MDFRKFNEAAELVGIAAVVASLIFVGLQLEQASDIAQNEVRLGIYTASIEINNKLSEHADIWIRGSRGDELNETEAFIFGGLMQNLNNQAYFGKTMWDQLGENERPSAEVHNFARMLHENPGARKAWFEWQRAYQPHRALRQVPLEATS